MRAVPFILCFAALAALSGCARARITTEIKARGAWTRTLSFTGQEKKEGQMGPTLDDVFLMPSGTGWKSHTVKSDKDNTVVVERTLQPGDALKGDLSIKAEGDKLQLVNNVTVKRLGPRRFEYTETLSWKAPKGPGQIGDIKPEQLAEIKAALPPALATDENARAFAEKASGLMVPLMFGPGDPLLAIGLMHPDLAERRASQRIGAAMMTALQEQFGDKMSAEQRKETVRKVIAELFASARPAQPDPSAGPPDKSSSGGLTPLMFIVKTPGHVVSSNGEVDEFTGEVFWALFPEAASLRDVTLTAVCELPQ
jgi:hypothetical protein